LAHFPPVNLQCPSMESCGIDVVQTAKNNGYTMIGKDNGKRVLYYYSLVLLE
jgi:hypothetical protein